MKYLSEMTDDQTTGCLIRARCPTGSPARPSLRGSSRYARFYDTRGGALGERVKPIDTDAAALTRIIAAGAQRFPDAEGGARTSISPGTRTFISWCR